MHKDPEIAKSPLNLRGSFKEGRHSLDMTSAGIGNIIGGFSIGTGIHKSKI
jgi:hypothetical protein